MSLPKVIFQNDSDDEPLAAHEGHQRKSLIIRLTTAIIANDLHSLQMSMIQYSYCLFSHQTDNFVVCLNVHTQTKLNKIRY